MGEVKPDSSYQVNVLLQLKEEIINNVTSSNDDDYISIGNGMKTSLYSPFIDFPTEIYHRRCRFIAKIELFLNDSFMEGYLNKVRENLWAYDDCKDIHNIRELRLSCAFEEINPDLKYNIYGRGRKGSWEPIGIDNGNHKKYVKYKKMYKYTQLKGCWITLEDEKIIFTENGFSIFGENSGYKSLDFKSKDKIIRNAPIPKWCISEIKRGNYIHVSSVELTDSKYVIIRGNIVVPQPHIFPDVNYKYEFGYYPGQTRIKVVHETTTEKTILGAYDGENFITTNKVVMRTENNKDYYNPCPEMTISPKLEVGEILPAKYEKNQYITIENREYIVENYKRVAQQPCIFVKIIDDYSDYEFDKNTKSWLVINHKNDKHFYDNSICFHSGENFDDTNKKYHQYMSPQTMRVVKDFLKSNPKLETTIETQKYKILSSKKVEEWTTVDHSSGCESDDGFRMEGFVTTHRRYELNIDFGTEVKTVIYLTVGELEEF